MPTQLQLDNAFRAKMNQPELNDDLTDVFGTTDPITHLCNNQDDDKVASMPTRLPRLPRLPPAHTEPCPKCRGSGRYSGYSSRGSHCFKCKGTGRLTFKSSAATPQHGARPSVRSATPPVPGWRPTSGWRSTRRRACGSRPSATASTSPARCTRPCTAGAV